MDNDRVTEASSRWRIIQTQHHSQPFAWGNQLGQCHLILLLRIFLFRSTDLWGLRPSLQISVGASLKSKLHKIAFDSLFCNQSDWTKILLILLFLLHGHLNISIPTTTYTPIFQPAELQLRQFSCYCNQAQAAETWYELFCRSVDRASVRLLGLIIMWNRLGLTNA